MIHVENMWKSFHVHVKEPGLKGSVKSLFSRKWTEKKAVKDVSFQVRPGEILGLIGSNGAGKTTIVKTLSGIIHPSSGKIEVLGFKPWERKNEFRKQIALIMGQKAQLWWDLPAADCFLLLKEIYQIPDSEYKERLDYLTRMLDVGSEVKVQIRRLSLGERMKMELIAALLHGPKVVFLDEPTIGLDLQAQRAVREFLLKYRDEHKPIMLLTSHYMEDIEQLCERIMILREGEKIYDGPLKTVVTQFAPSKVIRTQFSAEVTLEKLLQFGEVISSSLTEARWKVAKSDIPQVASRILSALPVSDLVIEEEDISNIIEAIMKTGKI